MSIASRKSVLPSPLLLCLLPHLLLIFLLHLAFSLLTVTGCGQLNVTDQFPPLPFLSSLAGSEANLAPSWCIFLCYFLLGLPTLGTYPFLGVYALIFLYALRRCAFWAFLHLPCTFYFCPFECEDTFCLWPSIYIGSLFIILCVHLASRHVILPVTWSSSVLVVSAED